MKNYSNREQLKTLVRSLQPGELEFLLTCADKERQSRHLRIRSRTAGSGLPAFAVPEEVPHLTSEQLEWVERAFRDRVDQARDGRQRLSRLRLWLVFLLLRYAGLRLSEALAFDDRRDVIAERSLILVRGAHAREVPLAAAVLQHLRQVLAEPGILALNGQSTRLDEGYLRRSFYARAEECGLPPRGLSARVLRNSRAIELCRGGMPLKIVHAFLGQQSVDRTANLLRYSEEDAKAIIHHYLHKEMKMKTSARNVLPGRVTQIRRSDFLVEVTLETDTGLQVVAVITEDSKSNLGLTEGSAATAVVKAPWVIIARPDYVNLREDTRTSARNRYEGRVSGLQRSEVATEVAVELSEGTQMCALISTSLYNSDLKIGDAVVVLFKAFSVILAVE